MDAHTHTHTHIPDYLQNAFQVDNKKKIYKYVHRLVNDKSKIENHIVKLTMVLVYTVIVFQGPIIVIPSCDSSEIHIVISVLNDFSSAQ
jgi:hypothetical protein